MHLTLYLKFSTFSSNEKVPITLHINYIVKSPSINKMIGANKIYISNLYSKNLVMPFLRAFRCLKLEKKIESYKTTLNKTINVELINAIEFLFFHNLKPVLLFTGTTVLKN